ncbi:MAG TPA: M48 family metalloprotease [Gaiellaceae bacterium]|nr:M48 family metalloprotease [Gaiellaceae bacterium]
MAASRLRRGRARRRQLTAAAALNFLKTWLLLAGTCALLGALGWALGGYRLLSIFVFCGLLAGAAVYWYSDRMVLGLVGARPLAEAEAPRYISAVERLAARARVPRPRLYLIRDPYPRALSAGRGGRGQTIAISTGLLVALAPAELEGVLAHEIAHAQRRDVLVQTTAAVVAATLLELSRLGGWFQRALLFVLGPIASAIVQGMLSPRREFAADRQAAELCESPHGLADALMRLDQAAELVSFAGNPATAPLHVVDPFEQRGLGALFSTHPPVVDRVRRLRALDPDQKSRAP